MYYTYAMGMNEKIYELESQGFKIKKRNGNCNLKYIS